ncbi:macro domain-containing protein [Bacillus rugosus]|uniref:Macro domain-containing protein n=1 Tax=Bacillus rugosus TaxID=2715209 RepID=A0ACD3ZV73_9BACI|nr:macro domain-containing protein [Bacillus rugosus]UPV77787.1 macro domain-containing protein [Bacillus rugosus]
MITYVKQDIFESPAQVLVNTVNTVGVMGKGIAKRFKQIYPEMFEQYQYFCETKNLDIGKLWIYKSNHKWILNFPTKKHWRSPSKIEYIEEGLKKFVETYEEKGINSISFPLLGCGNGGLDWEKEVKPLMEKYLRPLPIEVFIHLNGNNTKPEHKEINSTKKWLRSMPNFLSFSEVWEDLQLKIPFENTINSKGEEWEVLIDEIEILTEDNIEEKVLVIQFRQEGFVINLTINQLNEVWRYLRKVGFCTKKDLPEDLQRFSGLVFNLLNKLDYIEPVQLAVKYNNDSDFENGIRVLPYKMNASFQEKEGEIVIEPEK